MSYGERVSYPSFVEHKEWIESKWHKTWGDRMNELVFIGQDMDHQQIIHELERCLVMEHEASLVFTEDNWKDPFPENM